MQTVLSIVVVIGVLIFFHELGHLLMAKRSGILCREFAIGFGPKLFSFRKNETLYTIRLLPLGGYVRMAGEDPEMVEIKTGHDVGLVLNEEGQVEKLIMKDRPDPEALLINVQKIDLEHELFIEGYDEDEELRRFEVHPQALFVANHQEVQIAPYDRQFASKSLGKRAATIFAGPLANFLLAFVFLVGLGLYNGVPVDEPQIGQVLPQTVADEVGLQEGDTVLMVEDEPIQSWDHLRQIIEKNPGRELTFIVDRQGEQLEVNVSPAARENELAEGGEQGFIGVSPPMDHSLTGSLQYGLTQTVEISTLIFQAVGMLMTGEVSIDEGLAGPVGIFDITGQAAQAGLSSLVFWAALLSINLAVFNLLPIPALDGGRLIFIALEAIRGRPIDPHKEGMVHFIGFAFLMLLVLLVTWNDIQRVFFNR